MLSIITGDIVNSRLSISPENFLNPLRSALKYLGDKGEQWEIFRGDSFQIEISQAEEAFWKAVYLKAALKMHRIDVRLAIGLGEKTNHLDRVAESSGSAFYRSGATFEKLKSEKTTLLIETARPDLDEELNSCFQLALLTMDFWTQNSAEIVKVLIENPELTQSEIGKKIGIKQNTVSERIKRSAWDQLKRFDHVFRKKINQLQ